MLATAAVLPAITRLTVDRTIPVRLDLPAELGPYRGVDLLYCQSEVCAKAFRSDTLRHLTNCPACSNALDRISFPEKARLPADIEISRKLYEAPGEPGITLTIVVSGLDRRGIHRPELCLPGQGSLVQHERFVALPTTNTPPLTLKFIELRRPAAMTGGTDDLFCWAYWFIGKDHATPYHRDRVLWMARDALLEGVAYRWAYISLATARTPDDDGHIDRIARFLDVMLPYLQSAPPPAAQ